MLMDGPPCQAEEARTRGTPVTIESFKAWKANFDKEMSQRKMRDEEEKLRALTPKEREEIKKIGTRLTGPQPPPPPCPLMSVYNRSPTI